jgi:hypothetical protein
MHACAADKLNAPILLAAMLLSLSPTYHACTGVVQHHRDSTLDCDVVALSARQEEQGVQRQLKLGGRAWSITVCRVQHWLVDVTYL